MRTIELISTRRGNVVALLKTNQQVDHVYCAAEATLRNPTVDWQVLLGYFSDWLEDGQAPERSL